MTGNNSLQLLYVPGNICEETNSFILFSSIFNLMFHSCGYLFLLFFFANFKAVFFFFLVSLPIGLSELTDIRHNAFNCLTGKTAER